MSLAPNIIFTNNRLRIQSGADPTPSVITNGFGFNSEGRLCIATGAPTGSLYCGGFRMSAKGCVYGSNSAAAPDRYINGVGVDSNGALLFGNLAPTMYANGMPFVSTGRLATINA